MLGLLPFSYLSPYLHCSALLAYYTPNKYNFDVSAMLSELSFLYCFNYGHPRLPTVLSLRISCCFKKVYKKCTHDLIVLKALKTQEEENLEDEFSGNSLMMYLVTVCTILTPNPRNAVLACYSPVGNCRGLRVNSVSTQILIY